MGERETRGIEESAMGLIVRQQADGSRTVLRVANTTPEVARLVASTRTNPREFLGNLRFVHDRVPPRRPPRSKA
jgi:hypothetical protein